MELYYGIEIADKVEWVKNTVSEKEVNPMRQTVLPETRESLLQNGSHEVTAQLRSSAAESPV